MSRRRTTKGLPFETFAFRQGARKNGQAFLFGRRPIDGRRKGARQGVEPGAPLIGMIVILRDSSFLKDFDKQEKFRLVLGVAAVVETRSWRSRGR